MKKVFSLLNTLFLSRNGFSFVMPAIYSSPHSRMKPTLESVTSSTSLIEPSKRDTLYRDNIAQYLVDLHDNKTTFDFCGGMMFQFVLSDKLRTHLEKVANTNQNDLQPKIFDATNTRMFSLPSYSQNSNADNLTVFHGRELRKVPHAAGGFGFVLHLSLANDDPQGWSKEEIDEYDGWRPDSGRTWRQVDTYISEGFQDFKEKFGSKAFGLHHRFYLHYDSQNRMWLSAEDGCEGTPVLAGNKFTRFFGL